MGGLKRKSWQRIAKMIKIVSISILALTSSKDDHQNTKVLQDAWYVVAKMPPNLGSPMRLGSNRLTSNPVQFDTYGPLMAHAHHIPPLSSPQTTHRAAVFLLHEPLPALEGAHRAQIPEGLRGNVPEFRRPHTRSWFRRNCREVEVF